MRILTNPFEICKALGVGLQGNGPVNISLVVDDDGKPLHLLIGGGSGWHYSGSVSTATTCGAGVGGAGSGEVAPGPERVKTLAELGGAWPI